MKRVIACTLVVLAVAPGVSWAQVAAGEARPAPRVEVAFVVDTTGSMSGLIAAAKAKIWAIANQIVLGDPKPSVHMALVPYRDKGDEYVTKVFGLTANIDQVYTDLMSFRAAGGGDSPENVNQALYDAVHKLNWSADTKVLKIIYLVGDCPPHNEYKDVPTYEKLAKAAIEKGIYVNTVLCGGNAATRKVWIEIADRAEGTFMAIAADGGVKDIDTPFDKDLAKLNGELTRTVVVYGGKGKREHLGRLNEAAAAYSPKAQADRAVFSISAGIAASGDLLDAVRNKKVDLAKIETEKLPEKLQKMSPAERKDYLAKLQARRDEISAKIKGLAAQRAQYLKKNPPKAGRDGFDEKVLETLRKQAARKDITYRRPEGKDKDSDR